MCCAWVRTFVNRHACVTFWVHSWPTTANSKPDRAWIPTRLWSVTSGLRGTSVTVRGIGVLNKWLKCATETQSLLASTPCWHKCHMITLVTVHDFISIERFDFAHAFWRCRSNGDGSTCNRCACSRFKTPEQLLSPATGSHLLMWRYKLILNWYVGA